MKQLRELRKSANLSMKELGSILGVAESTISLYERNLRQADYETVKKIADYFHVSIDYLLGVTDAAQSPTVKPIKETQTKEIDRLVAQLTPDEERQAEEYLQFLITRRKDN